MIKVFLLILGPGSAWEKIAQSRRGYAFILATYLLPFMILVTWLEGWGLLHWGKWQPRFQVNKMFTADQVIPFEIAQFLVFLVTIFVCALIVLRVSQTFHERNKYLEAFTLTAYAFSPILLFHLLDVLPGISPWATWGVGVAFTIWILYQGIPRVLQPDPTHAFGLYLSSVFVIVLSSGLERLITGMYLLGYMSFEHSYLTRELSRFLPK
jgi:hypothetical protein